MELRTNLKNRPTCWWLWLEMVVVRRKDEVDEVRVGKHLPTRARRRGLAASIGLRRGLRNYLSHNIHIEALLEPKSDLLKNCI